MNNHKLTPSPPFILESQFELLFENEDWTKKRQKPLVLHPRRWKIRKSQQREIEFLKSLSKEQVEDIFQYKEAS